jgi:hypothetical protein
MFLNIFFVACVQLHSIYVHAIFDIKIIHNSPPNNLIFEKAKGFLGVGVCTRYIKILMNSKHIKLFVVGY